MVPLVGGGSELRVKRLPLNIKSARELCYLVRKHSLRLTEEACASVSGPSTSRFPPPCWAEGLQGLTAQQTLCNHKPHLSPANGISPSLTTCYKAAQERTRFHTSVCIRRRKPPFLALKIRMVYHHVSRLWRPKQMFFEILQMFKSPTPRRIQPMGKQDL